MRNRAPLIIGGVLILWGILAILGTIFHFDTGVLCWPLLLIGIGVFILLRPKLESPNAKSSVRFIGDYNRSGTWTVSDSDIWCFVGNTTLDFSQAEIPVGETHIHINGFVGDVRLYVPEGLGISISSSGVFMDVRWFDQHQEQFLGPATYSTPDYEASERRICLETFYFVTNIKIKNPK
jgi:predicted membrane protein